jgi:hypothetical protein
MPDTLLIYAKATGAPEDAGNLCMYTLLPLIEAGRPLAVRVLGQVAVQDGLLRERGGDDFIPLPGPTIKPWRRFDLDRVQRLGDLQGIVGPTPPVEEEMGRPAALQDFLDWARDMQGASLENRHLVFWGHGGGWRGTVMALLLRKLSQLLQQPMDSPALFELSGFGRPLEGEQRLAAIVDTLKENRSLQPREIGDAISAHLAAGQKLGLVGFHSCLSATIEVAYDLRAVASHVLASTDFVYYNEIPYDRWVTHPAVAEAHGAVEFAAPLFEQLRARGGPAPFFLIELGKIEAIKVALDNFCREIRGLSPSAAQELLDKLRTARNESMVFGRQFARTVDIGQLFHLFADHLVNQPPLQGLCRTVEAAAKAAICDRYDAESFRQLGPAAAGITIFFPATRKEADATFGFESGWYDSGGPYSASAFVDESCWRPFLDWFWGERPEIQCPA